ncbi:hypothetical protein [Acinetobacter rudis]|uniref:Uncharacterized protein n=1 Tax=Acinetobacter rudis TaxID=632955 RepID=A0AAW8JDP2_9GAMM|nr:hypothetical protein [Acinetobacter rudis]MDQ8936771.1 hypothetical protein [Acinetobacter rudis]MDQ8952941.1 hypothetical protein [Acinetobacter rudis]MDQ9018992.1 hypothetical protein [Acinetobacter rudis]
MNNLNPKAALIIGIIFLCVGAGLYWMTSKPSISVQDQQSCENALQAQYGAQSATLIDRCKTDVGFVAMTKAQNSGATSAHELATAISQANQKDTGSHMLYMFFIGLSLMVGLVLTLRGIKGLTQKPN